MAKNLNRQIRRQLDDRLSALNRALQRPKNGWIRTVRGALGMSSKDLARRMGVHESRIRRLEADEVKSRVTLSTLERAAQEMDCRLVYQLVPNGSFEGIVRRRARELARHRIDRTSRTMALENQRTSPKALAEMESDLVEEYMVAPPRDFWSREI